MKLSNAVLFLVSVLVSACDSGEGSSDDSAGALSPSSIDMTGTWLMTTERQVIKLDTDEYLYSEYYESRYVFDDTLQGVRYSACWDYARTSSAYGVKTDAHLYLQPSDPDDTGFIAINSNTLQRTSHYEAEWQPGFRHVQIDTLTRLSDGVEIDNGTVLMNGPISVNEYNHVCISKVYSNLGESRGLLFMVPYDDRHISFSLNYLGDLSPGTYSYNERWDSEAELLNMDVSSSAYDFSDIVGSNTLAPEDVTIIIIESNESRVSGTFDFLGQDGMRYDGEFEVFLEN